MCRAHGLSAKIMFGKIKGERMNKKLLTLLIALCTTTAWATGEETFQNVCATCHAKGDKGSPKIGDIKAWSKLIKEGQANITADGYAGVREMPARGSKPELSVAEFGAAVVYMANQAGANWKEPDEAMLKKINARIDKRSKTNK
jgi:cytochrome c5